VEEPAVTAITAEHERPRSLPDPPPLPPPEPEPEPVVRRPDRVGPVPVPGRLLALLTSCVVVLTVALAYPWDNHLSKGRSFFTPYFGADGALPNWKGGFFMALSPLVVVALTALATATVWRGQRIPMAAGALVATGVAASAKELGVLARTLNTNEGRVDSPVFFALAVGAAFALVLVGLQLAQLGNVHLGRGEACGRSGRESMLLAASGCLILLACLVPYNGEAGNTVLNYEGSLALDPLVAGLALLGAAACLRYLPRMLAAGMLVAIGLESFALWTRYIGVPAVLDSSTGSVGVGGFIGLAGAALAIGVGIRIAVVRREPVPEALPSLTPS
jgi:hypothetical protein